MFVNFQKFLLLLIGLAISIQCKLQVEELQPQIMEAVEGKFIELELVKTGYSRKKCTIELPIQMGIESEQEYDPNLSELLPVNVREGSFSFKKCVLGISDISYKEAGKWIMRSYLKDDKTDTSYVLQQEYNIRIVKQVDGLPHDSLTIAEGNDLYFRLKDPVPDMTVCSFRSPDGKTYTLWQQDQQSLTSTVLDESIQYWGSPKQGICGIKIADVKKNSAIASFLGIEAIDASNKIHISQLKVTVKPFLGSESNDNDRERSFTLGTRGVLDLTPKDSVWCRAKAQPEGNEELCRMYLEPVKRSDAKTWHVSWMPSGSAHVQEADVKVTVDEPRYINATVEQFVIGDRTYYNLLCSIRSRYIQHCVYERQDGKVVNMQPGVGTNRYSYYGNGFLTETYVSNDVTNECGLTIAGSQEEDVGIWKCAMDDANKEKNIPASVAFLTVGPIIKNEDIPQSRTQHRESFVSGNVTLSCWIRASLDYCFLQHPNGTMYVPSEENSSIDLYDRRAGRCGLQVYNVTAEESGEWGCRMGIAEGAEVTTKLIVTVHDKTIVPFGDTAIINSSPAIISCRVINNTPLSYCRFVRPDGLSIHSRDVLDVYTFTGDLVRGVCNLTIIEVSDADHGTWQCYAGLYDVNKEVTTNLRLMDSPMAFQSQGSVPFSLIILGSCTIVIIAVIAVTYKFKNKLRLKRYSRNPLPKPEDPIPIYLQADSPMPSSKA